MGKWSVILLSSRSMLYSGSWYGALWYKFNVYTAYSSIVTVHRSRKSSVLMQSDAELCSADHPSRTIGKGIGHFDEVSVNDNFRNPEIIKTVLGIPMLYSVKGLRRN